MASAQELQGRASKIASSREVLAAYLAGESAGERGHEAILLRSFGRRQVLSREGIQCGGVRRSHDGGDDALAPGVIGYAEHGDVVDADQFAEHVLDLDRIDVDAAGDDEVFASAVEVEVAVVVDPAEVAH